MQRSLFIFSLLLITQSSFAQEKGKFTDDLSHSLGLSQSLSHTGINSLLTFRTQYKRFQIYAGTKIALSDSYFEEDVEIGFALGGNYLSFKSEKSIGYFFLNYERVFYEPFLSDQYNTKKFNHTSELTVGIGQEWKIYNHWWLGGAMGYGRYYEVFHDLLEGEKVYFDDGTFLIRFSIIYQL